MLRTGGSAGFAILAAGQGIVAIQNLQPGEWDVAAMATIATIAAVGMALAMTRTPPRWTHLGLWLSLAALVQAFWVVRSITRGNPGFYLPAALILLSFAMLAWTTWSDRRTAGPDPRTLTTLLGLGALGFAGIAFWRFGNGFPVGAWGAVVAAVGMMVAATGRSNDAPAAR